MQLPALTGNPDQCSRHNAPLGAQPHCLCHLAIDILWYVTKANLMHYMYEYEHEIRLSAPAAPPATHHHKLMETRLPLVMNSRAAQVAEGVRPLPGTDQGHSVVHVPVLGSDRVL